MESEIKTDAKGRKTVLNTCTEPCAIERGMRLIGGKWTGSIIYHLKDEPVRFNDLCRMLGGASNALSAIMSASARRSGWTYAANRSKYYNAKARNIVHEKVLE